MYAAHSGTKVSPRKIRVAVAMSGGVDSAAAAIVMKESGHDVIGVTLRLYEAEGSAGFKDAEKIAEKLGIQHKVLDIREKFSEEIIKPFAETYARGETPNPCAVCNRKIKFGVLAEVARNIGADALATGHYARITADGGRAELHMAVDAARDQSYFLFATPRELLNFLRFPIGGMRKEEVRRLAAQFGLPVAEKPDSQDICFVSGGDYSDVVRKICPQAFLPGEITDVEGRKLGCHEGIINFTIGQRRGLNIGERTGENNAPLFVLEINPETHRVIVGPRAALAKTEVFLHDLNWLYEHILEDGFEAYVRLRSTQPPITARVFSMPDKSMCRIVLKEPVFGVAPGQAGVIYNGTRVLGGGWICRAGKG